VLIFVAEHAHQESIAGEVAAECFERAKIGAARSVARQSQRWVHLAPHADHERERDVEFAAGGQDGF